MSIWWTKRPQNFCASCGYSWYPKGSNRAAKCPRCGSARVELAFEGCLRALLYLIASPFILVIIAFQLIYRTLVGSLRLLARIIPAFGRLISVVARKVPVVGRWIGTGASEIAEYTGPLRGVVAERATQLVKGLYSGLIFVLRWVYSVKDDLFGEGERDLNPFSLVSKLLVVVVFSAASIIMVINLMMRVVS